MPIVMEKEEAHRLVDGLPKSAPRDDLMHEIYVRETIEQGSPIAEPVVRQK